MKATIRIPTYEYAYIEVQVEESPEMVVSIHNELRTLYKASCEATGLSEKDFNQATDKYFSEGKMDADTYAGMSTQQKDKIQWAKRSFNRTKNK